MYRALRQERSQAKTRSVLAPGWLVIIEQKPEKTDPVPVLIRLIRISTAFRGGNSKVKGRLIYIDLNI